MSEREWPAWLPEVIRHELKNLEQTAIMAATDDSFRIKFAAKHSHLQLWFLHEALTTPIPTFEYVARSFACVQKAQEVLEKACAEVWDETSTSKSLQVESVQSKVA